MARRRASGSRGQPPARSSGGARAAKIGFGAATLGIGAYEARKGYKWMKKFNPHVIVN